MESFMPLETKSRQTTDGSLPNFLATKSRRFLRSDEAVNVIRSVFLPSSTRRGAEKSRFICIEILLPAGNYRPLFSAFGFVQKTSIALPDLEFYEGIRPAEKFIFGFVEMVGLTGSHYFDEDISFPIVEIRTIFFNSHVECGGVEHPILMGEIIFNEINLVLVFMFAQGYIAFDFSDFRLDSPECNKALVTLVTRYTKVALPYLNGPRLAGHTLRGRSQFHLSMTGLALLYLFVKYGGFVTNAA